MNVNRAATPGRRLKVLIVARNLRFYSGIARCVLYLARACNRDRVEIHVASLVDPTEPMISEFKKLDISPVTLKDGWYLGPSWRLIKYARQHGIDIMVGTTFKTYVVAKMAAFRANLKTCFWLHAIEGVIQGRTRRTVFNRLSRRDPLMFVSEAVRRAHLPPGHWGKQVVIHNGVEDVAGDPAHAPYSREKVEEFGVPADALVLGYVAAFVANKDHATLIAAMGILQQRGINAHVLLLGEGKLMEQLRAYTATQPYASRVHFLGARNDARRWIGAIDMYVHPARDEGFGLAVVEAMLAQRPVIAAASGAIPEYVQPDVNGEQFELGNATNLADKVMKLAADPERARQMGKTAREYCLEHFSIDRFADRVCDFLELTVEA